ncbi:hypothetical protein [Roseobacter sp.]|uniref:hypothetical protein n=1 Tax=Roseobacter sp. TaxID=1907202 RepID=UPI00385D41BF
MKLNATPKGQVLIEDHHFAVFVAQTAFAIICLHVAVHRKRDTSVELVTTTLHQAAKFPTKSLFKPFWEAAVKTGLGFSQVLS